MLQKLYSERGIRTWKKVSWFWPKY